MSSRFVHGYDGRKIFVPTGIYDKAISILENPRVSDTRGQNFFALRAGICHTRGKYPWVYPRPRDTRPTLVLTGLSAGVPSD